MKTKDLSDNDSQKNAWITDQEKTLVDSPIMRIMERDCHSTEDPTKTHRFYLFQSSDWCNVIPVTEDGKIVFIRQFRIGISSHTLEIPGGVMDESDLNPEAAAIREMTEETGYAPLPGFRCEKLGWTFPNPALQNNRCHSFIVGPVRKVGEQKLDEAEMIDVIEIPISEVAEQILSGRITHALMLNTFFFATLKAEGGRNSLLDELRSFSQPST